jgi:hypothetical protein
VPFHHKKKEADRKMSVVKIVFDDPAIAIVTLASPQLVNFNVLGNAKVRYLHPTTTALEVVELVEAELSSAEVLKIRMDRSIPTDNAVKFPGWRVNGTGSADGGGRWAHDSGSGGGADLEFRPGSAMGGELQWVSPGVPPSITIRVRRI